jgi:hypothetical protein
MKKILLIAATILSLSISSALQAGEIEKAERYAAPLEQEVVEMEIATVETDVEALAQNEFELSLGSNAEIDELGRWYHRRMRRIIRYRRWRR